MLVPQIHSLVCPRSPGTETLARTVGSAWGRSRSGALGDKVTSVREAWRWDNTPMRAHCGVGDKVGSRVGCGDRPLPTET